MTTEIEAAAADALGAEIARRKLEHAPPPGTPCANCHVPLQGPFCHACGQGSDNHKRSIFRLLWEAVKDFFSWDGRFLRTIPTLFFRPGKLARDFLEGRIARHVPPFRLFLIALVVFFFAAEHMVDRMRDQTLREQRDRTFRVSTSTGRAAEAERIRQEAARARNTDLAGARAERADELKDKGADRAKVEAEYQADVKEAEADYAAAMKQATEVAAGRTTGGGLSSANLELDFLKNARLERGIRNAVENPDYYFVVVFTIGHRFAVLLLPILALSLGFAYLFKRKYVLFDHLVVSMNILSFAFLTNALGFVLPDPLQSAWVMLLVFWTPLNLFQTLRGAYGSSVWGAILKSLFLWTVNAIAFWTLIVAVLFFSLREMG